MAPRNFGLSHILVLLSCTLIPAIADTTGSGTSTGSGSGTGTNSGTNSGSGSFSVPGPTTGISTTGIPVPTIPHPTLPTLVPPGTTVVSTSPSSSVPSSSSQSPSGGTGTSSQTPAPPTQSPPGTGTGTPPVTTTSSSSSSLQPSPTTSSTSSPSPSGSSGTVVPTPGPTVTATSPRSSSTSTLSSTTSTPISTTSTLSSTTISFSSTSVLVVTAYATVTKVKYSTITEDFGPPTAFPPAVPVGCYNEGPRGRALPDFFFEDDVLMSIEKCVGLCPNYTFLGLEYGTQCWCSNSLQNGAFPVDNAQCDTVCAGNAREICGGDSTLSLFLPPPPPPKVPTNNITYTSAGCYAEPSDGSRALKKSRTATPDMTPSSCFNICGLSGFLYAGLEYGDECWCGNRVSSAASPVDASRCNMNCSGDATQTCGGSEVLDLYKGTYNSSAAASVSPHHASIWDRLFNGQI